MSRSKGITGLYQKKGVWHIDKYIHGYGRFCESTKESGRAQAEAYLARRILELYQELEERKKNGGVPRRTFREAALRYVSENRHIRSLSLTMLHLRQADPYLGALPLDQIHSGHAQLRKFIADRLSTELHKRVLQDDGSMVVVEEKVSPVTVNNTLRTIKRILNAASRDYRDTGDEGKTVPWLPVPPRIKMLNIEEQREGYPLSWEEQEFLFRELPPHLQRMALFKVNTGTRDEEVCQLQWAWEQQVPELPGVSVFVLPKKVVKNKKDRVVVLNRIARSVIDECRGMHPEFVFVYRRNVDRSVSKGTHRAHHTPQTPRRVNTMNNSAWQHARARAAVALAQKQGILVSELKEFANVRVHDLKHTFGRRLEASDVKESIKKRLLGHADGDISLLYSASEIHQLLEAADKVCGVGRSAPTLTLLRRRSI